MYSLLDSIFREGFEQVNGEVVVSAGVSTCSLSRLCLSQTVARLSTILHDIGIGPGSVCCLALPNGPPMVAMLLSLAACKATAAPLDIKLNERDLKFSLESMGCQAIVGYEGFTGGDTDLARAVRGHDCAVLECDWRDGAVILDVVRKTETMTPSSELLALGTGEDFVALLLHTSGTTGRPKAVPLLQSNLYASVQSVIHAYDLTAADKSVLIMPLFHIHGLVAGLLAPLLAGSCVIIPKQGLGPDFFTIFKKYEATWWTGTPTHQKIILSLSRASDAISPRFIRSCSSPLAPTLLAQMEETFQCRVLQAYAMTENAHHITSVLEHSPRDANSVGAPCRGLSLKILDEQGHHVPSGKPGEIVIKGVSVMPGYLANPEANCKAFTSDGFFRTGDVGILDEQGSLYLTGRIKEFINKGGEKVAPNDIDYVALEHEDVNEAVAFAVPDDMYGEDVNLAVVLKEGKQIQDLQLKDWLRQRLSSFKVPVQVWALDSIPKTATGKVQRKMVADAVLRRTEALEEDDVSPGRISGSDKDKRSTPVGLVGLKNLWSQVLGVQETGLHDGDNFFAVGADSAKAIRLASAARARGWDLDAGSIFRYPMMRDMAKHCRRGQVHSSGSPIVHTEGRGDLHDAAAKACAVPTCIVETVTPSTPLQKRLASSNQLSGQWVTSMTFACENVDLAALEACVGTVRQRNAIMRARTVVVADKMYTIFLQDAATWETASNLEAYLKQVANFQFLFGSPQVRYAYVPDREQGGFFVITMNHAVMDVWTRKLLYAELEAALRDSDALQERPAPPSYVRYAQAVDNIDQDQALRYYGNLLRGFDRCSYLRQSDVAGEPQPKTIKRTILVPVTMRQDLGGLLHVHLALALALQSTSGEQRIFFPTTTSGRLMDVPEIDTMMGTTLTTIPCCIDFVLVTTVAKALEHFREQLFGAAAYEPLAIDAMTQHFGTAQREILLNCSDTAESDGLLLTGCSGQLRLVDTPNKSRYARMTVPIMFSVFKNSGGFDVECSYDGSKLVDSTVEALLGYFVGHLDALGRADRQTSLHSISSL